MEFLGEKGDSGISTMHDLNQVTGNASTIRD
jgi:hypothetical protein